MKNSILPIARKELARFFSNKTSAIISILLPGLLLFGMWSIMGAAMDDMISPEGEESPKIAVANLPANIAPVLEGANIETITYDELPDKETIREDIKEGTYQTFAVFPNDFDEAVAQAVDAESADPVSQVSLYYDSTDTSSTSAYSALGALLDGYESMLSNLFDVNAAEGEYDVSDEKSRMASLLVSIVPMVLLMLLFSGCMAIAAESIAGEKERGTMATLLATPINRRDIALGKLLALTLIGLAIAVSSTIGVFAGLSNLTQGMVDVNVYGSMDYMLLALVIIATTLLIVILISLVSALAKTTKEAQLYLTPLMIVVMGVGILGMFGSAAQTELGYYFIPLYNSVQCMIGILNFDFQPINVIACIVSNVVYTGMGVLVLQKMFNSERLMFAR